MDSNDLETCMFFVDDSNIWIEAQKFAASGNQYMPRLEDSDVDPRLRIDIGKLVDTLRGRRKQGPSFLYGSRPPPNDSVWKAFEDKFRFNTKIYNRNSKNKEKEVDNSLATDLASEATELRVGAKYNDKVMEKKKKTVFVVITGDRDILPPVKKVLDSGLRVELWGWKNGIAKEYYNERSVLLSINHLDSEFDKIFFTNFRSTRKGNKAHTVDPARTIVLCGFDEPCAEDLDEDGVGRELITLSRLFYLTPSTATRDIFVEFPNVVNIEAMVHKARDLFDGTLRVVSWPEYAQRFNRPIPDVAEKKNIYKPLTDKRLPLSADNADPAEREPFKKANRSPSNGVIQTGDWEGEETRRLGNPDDGEGWQTVSRSDPAKDHRRAPSQTQRCSYRIRCRKRGECGFQHTKEETDLFRDNPTQNFGLWKTKRCNREFCNRGKRCAFAHPQEEGWCAFCRHEGHCSDECPYQ